MGQFMMTVMAFAVFGAVVATAQAENQTPSPPTVSRPVYGEEVEALLVDVFLIPVQRDVGRIQVKHDQPRRPLMRLPASLSVLWPTSVSTSCSTNRGSPQSVKQRANRRASKARPSASRVRLRSGYGRFAQTTHASGRRSEDDRERQSQSA
jgi:hypothetical protein